MHTPNLLGVLCSAGAVSNYNLIILMFLLFRSTLSCDSTAATFQSSVMRTTG